MDANYGDTPHATTEALTIAEEALAHWAPQAPEGWTLRVRPIEGMIEAIAPDGQWFGFYGVYWRTDPFGREYSAPWAPPIQWGWRT